MSRRTIIALAAVLAALSAVPAAASARVPRGFVGVVADGALTRAGLDSGSEMGVMDASGVETIRVPFHWREAQPHRTLAEIAPAQRPSYRLENGVPTTYAVFDRLVGDAARHGLSVLPIVTLSPAWAARHPGKLASPPAGTTNYSNFARALVRRYGPRGSYWAENPAVPRRPIRRWQLWNEPNLRTGWSDSGYAKGYVKLLRAGRAAVRAEDPGARIVLAGLANRSWRALDAIYRQRGARRLFDTVAIHPYTATPRGVIKILELARRTMRRHGDRRKALSVTEWSFPSSKGKAKGFGFETTRSGQARRVRDTLTLFARNRRRLRIASTYYYTWITQDSPSNASFDYAGLRTLDPGPKSKPALASFRRVARKLER
jgi:polysaccharide biosynthesis protein PslG